VIVDQSAAETTFVMFTLRPAAEVWKVRTR
jgi:hypothetical protein